MLHQPPPYRPHPCGPRTGIASESFISLAPSFLRFCKARFSVCKLAVLSPVVSRNDNPPLAGSTPSFCSRTTCKRCWFLSHPLQTPCGPPTPNTAILRVTVTPTSLDSGPCLMVLPSLASRSPSPGFPSCLLRTSLSKSPLFRIYQEFLASQT